MKEQKSSKAILVIDEMPKDCLDCELLNGYDNSCVGGKIGYDAIYEDRIKPKWCPLKPLPQKAEVGEIRKVDDFSRNG